MRVFNDDVGARSSTSSDRNIARIAEILDCPVEAFRGSPVGPLGLTSVSELLGLWAAIEGDADREALLDMARKLAKQ